MGAYWLRRIVDRYGCMSSFHGVLVKQTMKTITVSTYVSYAFSAMANLLTFLAPAAFVVAVA